MFILSWTIHFFNSTKSRSFSDCQNHILLSGHLTDPFIMPFITAMTVMDGKKYLIQNGIPKNGYIPDPRPVTFEMLETLYHTYKHSDRRQPHGSCIPSTHILYCHKVEGAGIHDLTALITAGCCALFLSWHSIPEKYKNYTRINGSSFLGFH